MESSTNTVTLNIHQDIIELNIRLSYYSRVPQWVKQQLENLCRLDGRAFSLPFDIIPDVAMSRKMVANVFTVLVVLGPYLFTLSHLMSGEYLCPSREDWAEQFEGNR